MAAVSTEEVVSETVPAIERAIVQEAVCPEYMKELAPFVTPLLTDL